MNLHQGLAQRVAALRQRLEEIGQLTQPEQRPETPADPAGVQQLRRELQHLEGVNAHLDARLAELCPELALETEPDPLPRQLAWKTRRLLLQGRELLDELKDLATRLPTHPEPDDDPLLSLYRQTLVLAELALRSVRSFPESTAEQLRLCDGLEALLGLLSQRVAGLRSLVRKQQMLEARIDALANLLTSLVQGRPVLLRPFQELAEKLTAEAEEGAPLRWFQAPPADPARWAAVHALHVAQVLARLAPRDPDWQGTAADATLAGLLFDAGMAAMPADLLRQDGPLTDRQRRFLESHVGMAAEAVQRLAPQQVWLLDAIRGHHERLDGTGYPAGLKGPQLLPLTRLVAVADTYAAIACWRAHRAAESPRSALMATLLEAEKGRLDPVRAQLLLELSFYPVGTVVELSDGQVGWVAATHPLHGNLATPARPVVLLLQAHDGQTPPWPEHVDLAAGEGRHIVRSLTREEARDRLGCRHWQLL